ncbi:hypothetical protein N182_18490 [Sinorhizobium sp. GL2]|nr:hypothetical protein N182_18490 [Sinorhizobium sp. GL2]
MFVSLPTPRGTDAEGLLNGYFVALEGLPLTAVQSVVTKLVKGTWIEPVTFCPRPPELASMVRKEHAMMRERSAPSVSHLPAPYSFKDLRVTHRERSRELAAQGYVRVAEGIDQQMFGSLAKSRGLPAGSVLLWAIDEVWAPEAVAHLVDLRRVESSKRMAAPERETLSPERAAELEKMLALPDAKDIRAEQMAYRSLVENEVAAASPQTTEQAA